MKAVRMHVDANNMSRVIKFVHLCLNVVQYLGGGNCEFDITEARKKIDHQEIFCWIANKVILKLSQSFSLFWNTHVHSYKNKIVWEITSDSRSMKWSMNDI